MQTIRFIYKNQWRAGTVLTQSSEHAQFPADNTQDDLTTLAWKSRHGSGSGNGQFVIGATNKYIDFDEGGAELTATITPATYTGQSLVTEIKTRMDAAGALTYTVTYVESTGKFTIAASGNFTLRWQSGTNTANTAGVPLGFNVAANDTGTDTYTGDYISIHTSEFIDNDAGSALEYDTVAIIGHNLTATAVIKIYGADDDAFTTNVVSDTLTYNANNIYEFLAAARTKRYRRIYIDDTDNPSCYVQIGVIVLGKYFTPNRNFGPFSEGEIDESETETSPSGAVFTVAEQDKKINWELPFTGLNAVAVAEVRLMIANNGATKALVICKDYTAANANSYWVKFKGSPEPPECQHLADNVAYWNWSASLEEVL